MGNMIILTDLPEPEAPRLPAPEPTTNTAGKVLSLAIERGADVETLERLLTLEMKYRAWQAELAYQQDFLLFKQEPNLKILRDEVVEFESKRTGDRTRYAYSPLDRAEAVLIPLLAKHNFTHHWRTEPQTNGWTKVTCVLKHLLCHENADASLLGPPDQTGSKNAHQAIGSNTSYLERYTLCAACGITPRNVDRDARTEAFVALEVAPEALEVEPDLVGPLRESVKQVETKKQNKFPAEEKQLRAAKTEFDLAKVWAAIGKPARQALKQVKDECKRALTQEVPCN